MFQAVLVSLNLIDKAKEGDLSKEDWDKIANSFKETHGKDFYAAMQEAEAAAKQSEEDKKKAAAHDMALQTLDSAAGADDTSDLNEDGSQAANTDKTLEERVASMAKELGDVKKENVTLRNAINNIEPDNAEKVDIQIAIT